MFDFKPPIDGFATVATISRGAEYLVFARIRFSGSTVRPFGLVETRQYAYADADCVKSDRAFNDKNKLCSLRRDVVRWVVGPDLVPFSPGVSQHEHGRPTSTDWWGSGCAEVDEMTRDMIFTGFSNLVWQFLRRRT
jgi:hypothetical protein